MFKKYFFWINFFNKGLRQNMYFLLILCTNIFFQIQTYATRLPLSSLYLDFINFCVEILFCLPIIKEQKYSKIFQLFCSRFLSALGIPEYLLWFLGDYSWPLVRVEVCRGVGVRDTDDGFPLPPRSLTQRLLPLLVPGGGTIKEHKLVSKV